jgi:hypothetical protein
MYGQFFGLHPTRSRIGLALALVTIAVLGTCFNASADEALPSSIPDFPSVIHTYSHQLAKIESDKDAINLFVSAIGPTLQLDDAAKTLRMNPSSVKLMNELLVPDLTATARRLIGNLSAWRLASTVREAMKGRQLATIHEQLFGSPEARTWLDQQRNMPWNDSLTQLTTLITSPEWSRESQGDSIPTLLISVLEQATRMEVAAMQATYQEWDRIRNWKDRVRGLRGQARLCGTWQWIIHNHQRNHQEQKFSLVFPPAGHSESLPPGLVEYFILGENVYLRWETDRLAQEDSLQFSKEGHRLEGTFVNSQGGWGSISGKRTASCTS